jgi:hypothetical protein
MATLTLKQLDPFMVRWIDDEIQDTGMHMVGRLTLQYTPDTLHFGRGTHAIAYKNRKVKAMVVPDLEVVKFHSNFEAAYNRLSNCWTPRRELRPVPPTPEHPSGEWEWHELPGLVWSLAPVDVLCPSLQHCDLATLQHRSLPVLLRWSDRLLRRYARAKNSRDLDLLTRDWDDVVEHFSSLQLTIPATSLHKRLQMLAKVRLTQNS